MPEWIFTRPENSAHDVRVYSNGVPIRTVQNCKNWEKIPLIFFDRFTLVIWKNQIWINVFHVPFEGLAVELFTQF